MGRGTVCHYCWLLWDQPHDASRCRVRWFEDGMRTVCMCGCAKREAAKKAEVKG